jgi:hypothetical protein
MIFLLSACWYLHSDDQVEWIWTFVKFILILPSTP